MQLVLAFTLIAGGWLAFDGGSTLALNVCDFFSPVPYISIDFETQ
jgi:ammonia channel protein AmtB